MGVKEKTIVKFDTQVYGTGVENGVFTAPIDGLFQINFKVDFWGSSSYWVNFKIRKNGENIQYNYFNGDKSSAVLSGDAKSFFTFIKVDLVRGDTIDLYSHKTSGATYDLYTESTQSYIEGKII